MLEAGREAVVRVGDAGLLALDLRDASGRLVAAEARVLDPKSGLVLATAANGEQVAALPGTYRVVFATRPPVTRDRVRVRRGERVRVGQAVQAPPRPGRTGR